MERELDLACFCLTRKCSGQGLTGFGGVLRCVIPDRGFTSC